MKKKKSMGMNFWSSPSSTMKNKIYQPNFRKQKAKINAFNTSMNKPAKYFWGDRDGDGIINMLDCAPNNPRKQGPQHKNITSQFGVLGRIARAEKKVSYRKEEVKALEREAKKREEVQRKEIEKSYRRRLASAEEEHGETPTGRKRLSEIRGQLLMEQEEKIKNVPKEDFSTNKKELAQLKNRAKLVKERFNRDAAVTQRVSEVSQRVLSSALPVNETVGAFADDRKQMLRSSQGLFSQMSSDVGVRQKSSYAPGKGTGKAGRPKGTVKYYIPGVGAVGVYEWRRYVAQQTRIKRAKGELNTGNEPVAAEPSSPRQQQAYSQPEQKSAMTQVVEAMRARQGQSSASDVEQMQQQMQEDDQILKAPQFAKGELKATGGSILTPNGPNILDAPNIMKGQMRNIQERNPVEVGNGPVTNPGSDEYIEIDPISGKPFVVKRVTEKWISGAAL